MSRRVGCNNPERRKPGNLYLNCRREDDNPVNVTGRAKGKRGDRGDRELESAYFGNMNEPMSKGSFGSPDGAGMGRPWRP